jgi:hypothetical protein
MYSGRNSNQAPPELKSRTILWYHLFGSLVQNILALLIIIFFPFILTDLKIRQSPFSENNHLEKNKKLWEELIAYFLLIRHRPHRKRRVQKFFYCCVCIILRGNGFT